MVRKISLAEARKLILQCQLLGDYTFSTGDNYVEQTIEHLSYIQIDTLAVVERAHHHTLWSRVPDYQSTALDRLIREKKIFEYWSHAASYLPMKDFRFSLVRKREYANGKSHWFDQDMKMKRFVLDRIKKEGPLQSKNFEARKGEPRSWYYWKPAKRALEQLFMEGKLMVSHRQGFQKVYDLAENVLPPDVGTKVPSKREFAEFLVKRALQSFGIVMPNEISYQRGPWSEPVKSTLRKMVKEESIREVSLHDNQKDKFYVDDKLLQQLNSNPVKPIVHILSPFDNLLIQRRRIERIFDFDYTVECYLPEHKRKFGYFTLPVLYGDQFIARLDPKADRESKTFFVRNLTFENNVKVSEEMIGAIAEKLRLFVRFNGCERTIIERSNNKGAKQTLSKLINELAR